MEKKTLIDLLENTVRIYGNSDLLFYRKNNKWERITVNEFGDMVKKVAAALYGLGFRRGDHIGILSNSSPFWVIADNAILLMGAVTVPIFKRISPENLQFEIIDSALTCIFIGDESEYDAVLSNSKNIKKIITIDFNKTDANSISFSELLDLGNMAIEAAPDVVSSFDKPGSEDLATIIYTSGSMGIPKGVRLTHGNITSQVNFAGTLFPVNRLNDIALTSLPLSHIFERMVMYYYLSCGLPVYFVDDLANIGTYIRELRPTIMTVVPRLLEKIYEKMKRKIDENTGFKKMIGQAAFARAEKKDPEIPFRGFRDAIFKKLVYSKFSAAMGGRFRYVIVGAASMPVDIGRFFLNIGLPLYEGYGLTEASPVIAANRPGANKLGSVGQAYGDVVIKISDSGEILANGPNIMMGYHNNPAETAKMIDNDGFLHTGDLGKFDSDGFLTIVGRAKELFKKSTGEYVPPVPIEQALSRLDVIDMAVVIADNRRFVSTLIFPNFEVVNEYKVKTGNSNMSVNDFLDTDFINDKIKNHVAEVNSHLHHTEEVQKYTIIKKPISIETGEITPTMKLRRKIVEDEFKREIEKMYQ